MSFNVAWWEEKDRMIVNITGMFITKLTTTIEVGSLPKVDFEMHVNAFLEKLTEDELEKMAGLIKKVQINKLSVAMPLCIHGFPLYKCKTCWKL